MSTITRLAGSAVFIAAAIAVTAATARAQAPEHGHPGREKCMQAAHVLAKGGPAVRWEWAVLTIQRCGGDQAASASVASLRAIRLERDTTMLKERLEPFWALQDSSFHAQAALLAADAGASPQARVAALRHLMGIVHEGTLSASFTSLMSDGGECRIGAVPFSAARGAVPVPADARQRLVTTVSQLLGDAGAPAVVRSAAACVRRAVDY